MKPVDDVKRRREELENKPELDLRQLWDQAQVCISIDFARHVGSLKARIN